MSAADQGHFLKHLYIQHAAFNRDLARIDKRYLAPRFRGLLRVWNSEMLKEALEEQLLWLQGAQDAGAVQHLRELWNNIDNVGLAIASPEIPRFLASRLTTQAPVIEGPESARSEELLFERSEIELQIIEHEFQMLRDLARSTNASRPDIDALLAEHLGDFTARQVPGDAIQMTGLVALRRVALQSVGVPEGQAFAGGDSLTNELIYDTSTSLMNLLDAREIAGGDVMTTLGDEVNICRFAEIALDPMSEQAALDVIAATTLSNQQNEELSNAAERLQALADDPNYPATSKLISLAKTSFEMHAKREPRTLYELVGELSRYFEARSRFTASLQDPLVGSTFLSETDPFAFDAHLRNLLQSAPRQEPEEPGVALEELRTMFMAQIFQAINPAVSIRERSAQVSLVAAHLSGSNSPDAIFRPSQIHGLMRELEDGQLNEDLAAAVRTTVEALNEHAFRTSNSPFDPLVLTPFLNRTRPLDMNSLLDYLNQQRDIVATSSPALTLNIRDWTADLKALQRDAGLDNSESISQFLNAVHLDGIQRKQRESLAQVVIAFCSTYSLERPVLEHAMGRARMRRNSFMAISADPIAWKDLRSVSQWMSKYMTTHITPSERLDYRVLLGEFRFLGDEQEKQGPITADDISQARMALGAALRLPSGRNANEVFDEVVAVLKTHLPHKLTVDVQPLDRSARPTATELLTMIRIRKRTNAISPRTEKAELAAIRQLISLMPGTRTSTSAQVDAELIDSAMQHIATDFEMDAVKRIETITALEDIAIFVNRIRGNDSASIANPHAFQRSALSELPVLSPHIVSQAGKQLGHELMRAILSETRAVEIVTLGELPEFLWSDARIRNDIDKRVPGASEQETRELVDLQIQRRERLLSADNPVEIRVLATGSLPTDAGGHQLLKRAAQKPHFSIKSFAAERTDPEPKITSVITNTNGQRVRQERPAFSTSNTRLTTSALDLAIPRSSRQGPDGPTPGDTGTVNPKPTPKLGPDGGASGGAAPAPETTPPVVSPREQPNPSPGPTDPDGPAKARYGIATPKQLPPTPHTAVPRRPDSGRAQVPPVETTQKRSVAPQRPAPTTRQGEGHVSVGEPAIPKTRPAPSSPRKSKTLDSQGADQPLSPRPVPAPRNIPGFTSHDRDTPESFSNVSPSSGPKLEGPHDAHPLGGSTPDQQPPTSTSERACLEGPSTASIEQPRASEATEGPAVDHREIERRRPPDMRI